MKSQPNDQPALEIIRADSTHPAFQQLVAQLDTFLAQLNKSNNPFYATHNKVDGIPTVVIATLNGSPAGCGAFRPHQDHAVEIKRMFVLPKFRGQSIGKAILTDLENWAMESGFTRANLETSKRLTAAINLYTTRGYTMIPNYPPYEAAPDSVCMTKPLKPSPMI